MSASGGGSFRSSFSSSAGRGVRPWPGAPRCWPRPRSERDVSCFSLLLPKTAFDKTARDERSWAIRACSLALWARSAFILLPSRPFALRCRAISLCSDSMVLFRARTTLKTADSRGRSASSASSFRFLMAHVLRAMRRPMMRLSCSSMRTFWSPKTAIHWRRVPTSAVSLRAVFLRSGHCSCSRRSRWFSRFSRRASRLREPTSPRSALIVSFCLRARSSALRSRAPALGGGEACAACFNLPRSAATFLRNAAISSFRSCERSRALLSRAFSRVSSRTFRFREATSPRSGPAVSLPGFGVCEASRSRKTSMRSDTIVLRLLDSTPASESSFSSRATSDW